MSLQISSTHLQQIHQQLETAYPQEGCGLLIGFISSDRQRTTTEVWPAENTWAAVASEPEPFDSEDRPHSRNDRYRIDPKFLLSAQRYCSDRNLRIIGIYHSHPNHPAIPSECDRRLAWPEYAYLIVSIQEEIVVESLSWCLNAEHEFESEALIIQQ